MTAPAAGRLTTQEKVLYHQINPLKLATDISTAAVSAYLLARRELLLALLVMWIPSIVVTAVLVRFGDFSRTRDSRGGRYLRRYMTRGMQAVRFGGEGIVAVSAWFHAWALIPVGVLVIVWGWSGRALVERVRRN